ncbi:MAG: D-2-hydroxyacid dehydrogenase [Hyphomicrobiaceae bacterium]
MKAVLRTFRPDDPNLRIAEDVSQIEWAVPWTPDETAAAMPGAEVLVLTNRSCLPEFGPAIRANAQSLRWIHFLTAGLDKGVAMGLPAGPVVTNSTGIKAAAVSEHAVTLLLALTRRLPDFARLQRERVWARDTMNETGRSLTQMTVCVIGLGAIGRATVARLVPFGPRLIAVSRAGDADGVSAVFARARLHEALAQSDAVIVATGADSETENMIGTAEIAALKPGSFVVNIARGTLIDEPALIAALSSGHVAGAGLDVQATEPLPADHPLWTAPNVVITPHLAGALTSDYEATKALFLDNLARLNDGRDLINVVDVKRADA